MCYSVASRSQLDSRVLNSVRGSRVAVCKLVPFSFSLALEMRLSNVEPVPPCRPAELFTALLDEKGEDAH